MCIDLYSAAPLATPPKLKITKTAIGGTGSFAFDLTGTSAASDTINATSAGSVFTGSTSITGTVGTAISISERPTANFPASATNISCTNASANNAVVASVTGGASVTIPASSVTPGADITCAVTNNFVAPLDAVDDSASKPPAVSSSTNVGVNDQFPANSTFTVIGGTCSNTSPVSPATNTSGVLTYTLPAGVNSCTVLYKLCAPAPNASRCDTATLTVTASAPSITVSKAMDGNRASSSDQFTVQIASNGNTLASSTTQGSGSTVVAGTGSIASFAATAGTSYTIGETMATGSDSPLAYYSGTLRCTNGSGTTLPSALGAPFTVQTGDTINCTLTNALKPVTLTIRQLTLSPVPPNLVLPFTFGYTGTNGLTAQSLTNTAFLVAVVGSTQTLAAFNTATTLSVVNFPEARWLVGGFSCIDTNAPGSGNPTGNLVSVVANSITVPAANVRPGAALRCTALMRHPVP